MTLQPFQDVLIGIENSASSPSTSILLKYKPSFFQPTKNTQWFQVTQNPKALNTCQLTKILSKTKEFLIIFQYVHQYLVIPQNSVPHDYQVYLNTETKPFRTILE